MKETPEGFLVTFKELNKQKTLALWRQPLLVLGKNIYGRKQAKQQCNTE